MNNKDSLRQTNAFAMQYGLLLGAWSLAGLALYILAFRMPMLGFASELMLIGSLPLAYFFTTKFRSNVCPEGNFTFSRGYFHTLFMGLYAGLWIALGVYAYFYFTGGDAFITGLQLQAERPDSQEIFATLEDQGLFDQMFELTGTDNIHDLFETFRQIPAATYAGMVVSSTLMSAPIISFFIGLLTRKQTNKLKE